jgi:glutaredoxin
MIVIYTKENCSFCSRAKQLATDKGIAHSVIKIGVDIPTNEFKDMFPNTHTVPQIHEVTSSGNRYIGGYVEFSNWVSSIEMLGEMSL